MAEGDLFDGVHLDATFYPALERFCAVFSLMDEATSEKMRHAVEYMTEHHDPDVPQRVWWHYKSSKDSDGWISINPGEYRTTPPEPPCDIRKLPEGTPRVSVRTILNRGVERAASVPPVYPAEHIALARAKSILAGSHHQSNLEMCRRIVAFSPENSTQIQDFCNELFEDHLFELRCTVFDFTRAMFLFRLPITFGEKIEQDWSNHSAGALREYMRLKLEGVDSVKILCDVAKSERRQGRSAIEAALDGSMQMLPRHLLFAEHSFMGANLIVKKLVDRGIPANSLPFAANLAEESFACTMSGLHSSAVFFLDHPMEWARHLMRRSRGKVGAEARAEVEHNCSAVQPTFTRTFGDILLAQARVLSNYGDEIRCGVGELLAMKDKLNSFDFGVEREWIDYSLLEAYRRLEDEDAAKGVAAALAGQMVSRIGLSKMGGARSTENGAAPEPRNRERGC